MMMRSVIKFITILVVGVMLTISVPSMALAATTADVVITATPTYIAMTNTPSSWAIGVIAASSTNPTANDSYFAASNNGSVTSNITLLVTTANWTGGVGWIHSNTNTTGADTVGLAYGTQGSGTDQYILKTTAEDLVTGLASANYTRWGMKMYAPTSFGDGVQKTVTVRLTIVQF